MTMRLPVDVIPVEAPAGGQLDIMAAPTSETDQDGQFAVDYILPGRYVVAVNARFGPMLAMRRHAPDGSEHGPDAHVFGNEFGQPVKYWRVNQAWHDTCAAAGIT